MPLAPVFVGAILSPPVAESAKRPPSPPTEYGVNAAAGLSGRPSPLRERFFFTTLLRGELLPPSWALVFMGAISFALSGEPAERPPSLPPKFGSDAAAGISGRPSPLRERFFLRRCCAGSSPPYHLRPSSWAPSPRCHAGSSPGVRHLLRHNVAPIWPPGSAGGPPPLRERFFCRTVARGVLCPGLGALLRGHHLVAAGRGVRRAAPIAATIIWRR